MDVVLGPSRHRPIVARVTPARLWYDGIMACLNADWSQGCSPRDLSCFARTLGRPSVTGQGVGATRFGFLKRAGFEFPSKSASSKRLEAAKPSLRYSNSSGDR